MHKTIIISGAGVPGLLLSILLARSGFHIHLIDPAPAEKLKDIMPSGFTSAIMQDALEAVKQTNSWNVIQDFIAPLKTITICDRTLPGKEPTSISFSSRDIEQDMFGYNIPNYILRAALTEEAEGIKTITFHKKVKLDTYTATDFDVTAVLENGTEITGTLIIGADGRHSTVRQTAGITQKQIDYGIDAISLLVSHSKPHNNISTEIHRPCGPLTFVPLPGKTSSVVWTEKHDKASDIVGMRIQDIERHLHDLSGGILGTLKVQSAVNVHPLITLRSPKFSAKRAVILAEAAHVLHPLGAQGLNMSIRDVQAFIDVIQDATDLGLDIGSSAVLGQYQQRRIFDTNKRLASVHGLVSLLTHDIKPVHFLRRFGLQVTDSFPLLKRIMMQEGMRGIAA